jgi:2-haloacid dehalogenase
MTRHSHAAVFDVGRVLFQWQLRALFEKLIDDEHELDWFLANVVSEEWHFQHDRGTPLAEMLPKRMAEFPDYAILIAAYAARFNETVPGEVKGTHSIVRRLADRDVPLFCLTNFGHELFAGFRSQHAIFDLFDEIIVSGTERIAKPDPRIYAIVEERSGFASSGLFFTDDNPANVDAALARGWNAHLFTDAAALERQLVEAGLL